MKEYYASILSEEFLMEKAKTDKRIGCALENLLLLNDDEYNSLYAFFMHEGCASNFVWRYTGSCYLMLLRERDPVRFRNNFSSAFFKIYGSCDNPVFLEDYTDLQGLLIVCDFDVYKQLLKLSVNSSDEEIKQNAAECMNDVFDDYKEELFVKAILDENSKFKRKLYELKKLQNSVKIRIKEFSSFDFISFFEDEEILAKVRKIFQYDAPVAYRKEQKLNNDVYCQWLNTVFESLELSDNLAVILDGMRLWCKIKVISYNDFSRELIELNPNRDFTLIDLNKQIAVDFSSGETDYEIRVLEYMK